jgi:sec-independent protein translocase protein TatA
MFGLGATELLIVLMVLLVLFGGTQLPKLARSMGQAQREFQKGTNTPVESEDAT